MPDSLEALTMLTLTYLDSPAENRTRLLKLTSYFDTPLHQRFVSRDDIMFLKEHPYNRPAWTYTKVNPTSFYTLGIGSFCEREIKNFNTGPNTIDLMPWSSDVYCGNMGSLGAIRIGR